jgi:hypothetical protein
MMVANKRITDLSDYKTVLPYASELFGVYQPLLGWKSKRKKRRNKKSSLIARLKTIDVVIQNFVGQSALQFNADYQLEGGRVFLGELGTGKLRRPEGGLIIDEVMKKIVAHGKRPVAADWLDIINPPDLESMLNGPVLAAFKGKYEERYRTAMRAPNFDPAALERWATAEMNVESALAGGLAAITSRGDWNVFDEMFYGGTPNFTVEEMLDATQALSDPLNTFDPTKQAGDVSVSPVGVVHLFRQYFFELDSFLGTPVGHVWLSPGSNVELIEVSTRRTITEQIIETSLETTRKEETSTTTEDEISDAIKQDNRQDTKLGFSTTVNQSWGSGNATATGTLDLGRTQDTAREQTHKRMRQQTEKLSTEIRQNFKSTFRTTTETVDTSSKRYLLNNTTNDLINYELRRKMRQVGVQVQDVGSYLCWETFVDLPGDALGLPNLINIAKPADLILVPDPAQIPMPPLTLSTSFTGEVVWNFPSNQRQYGANHPEVQGRFVPLNTIDIPDIPADYDVMFNPADPFVLVEKSVVAAEDDDSWNAVNWGMLGMFSTDGKRITIGIITSPQGLAWDDRITFKVSGSVNLALKASKRAEIDTANSAIISTKAAANAENKRRSEEAYNNAVKDRVTLASKIVKRRFEDMREEERIIVYRRLIADLMTEQLYANIPETDSGNEMRHVLSELLNSIFDIDKMLYFVAPEWWKPRDRARLLLGGQAIGSSMNGNVVRWADDAAHPKYFITEKSDPAPLGASLGWLMQLDGDDLRNAFLNAPWVKAVIPIRPGKEVAAINWLQSVKVEGADGMTNIYSGTDEEVDAIRANLLAHDPDDPVKDHAQVTIGDAVRSLCISVAEKHAQSVKTGRYPKDEISDDNRVSATPIEKVYEHGFYPLQGGFKAVSEEPFEVFDQWIEVLPTDQVVPVPVKYDPRTGRQLPPVP